MQRDSRWQQMKMHDWEFTHGEETAIAFFTTAMADGFVE